MQTTIQHSVFQLPGTKLVKVSLWKRFIAWCKGQQEHRILWLAVSLLGHGCFITILTLFAIIFSGNSIILWPFAIVAMGMPLVANLAAMPTKITIPLFALGVLIDLVIIITCIIIGFDFNSVYR
jgi:hypothetical protein